MKASATQKSTAFNNCSTAFKPKNDAAFRNPVDTVALSNGADKNDAGIPGLSSFKKMFKPKHPAKIKTKTVKIVNGELYAVGEADWKEVLKLKRNTRLHQHGILKGTLENLKNVITDRDKAQLYAMSLGWKNMRIELERVAEEALNSAKKAEKKKKKEQLKKEMEKIIKDSPGAELQVKYGEGFVEIAGVKLDVNG